MDSRHDLTMDKWGSPCWLNGLRYGIAGRGVHTMFENTHSHMTTLLRIMNSKVLGVSSFPDSSESTFVLRVCSYENTLISMKPLFADPVQSHGSEVPVDRY